MRRTIVLITLLTGACGLRTGSLVTAVQHVPSTVPIAGQPYDVGAWVRAERCDYPDSDFSVADLVAEAQGQPYVSTRVRHSPLEFTEQGVK